MATNWDTKEGRALRARIDRGVSARLRDRPGRLGSASALRIAIENRFHRAGRGAPSTKGAKVGDLEAINYAMAWLAAYHPADCLDIAAINAAAAEYKAQSVAKEISLDVGGE